MATAVVLMAVFASFGLIRGFYLFHCLNVYIFPFAFQLTSAYVALALSYITVKPSHCIANWLIRCLVADNIYAQ